MSYSQDGDKMEKLINKDEEVEKSTVVRDEDINKILNDKALFADVSKSIFAAINCDNSGILTKGKILKIEESFMSGLYKGGEDVKYRQMILSIAYGLLGD